VATDHAAARLAAERVVSLRPLQVSVTEGAGTITVTVAYDDPTDVPVVGAVLPTVTVSATVTMAVEPPAGSG
jgi:hypothetical protein